MSCETCKSDGKGQSVPFVVHESAMARNERAVKRIIIALVIAIALIFASNAIWLYAWMQYDYSSEESVVDVDAESGIANYIGNDGDIVNSADYGN